MSDRAEPGGTSGEPPVREGRAASENHVGPDGEGFRLALRLDRVEAVLDGLKAEVEESGRQVRALTTHLTTPEAVDGRARNLAELLTRVEEAHERLEELATAMSRLGRVQFKANALQDGTHERVEGALAALREIAVRRDEVRATREAEEARRTDELRSEGRAEMAAEMLPVLDGIERALESGRLLLERNPADEGRRAPERGLLRSLLRGLAGPAAPSGHPGGEPLQALASWLEGLELGRERFLALLAAEDIRRIDALDRAFDPHLHAAVATEARADVAPGTVIRVLRTGYQRGGRLLRFAEVVLSRAPGDTADDGAGEPAPASTSPSAPAREDRP